MIQPKWYEYMLPVLQILGDEKEHERNSLIDAVALKMKLSKELMLDEINSGTPVYRNRCGWAITYLKQSELIEAVRRGVFKICDLGIEFLKSNPTKMSLEDLEKYPGYKNFKERTKSSYDNKNDISEAEISSPDELIQKVENEFKEIACNELLEKVRLMSDKGFEKLVIKLLLAMGYGDVNDPKSGFVVGKAGDGGIDGIIKQDKLGINNIYVQAKRYCENNKVSPHDVRDFAGALLGKENGNTRTGIFITSSDFTKEGMEFAKNLNNMRIILINGKDLAEYMYVYGIGVAKYKTIILNKVDNDFFDEN